MRTSYIPVIPWPNIVCKSTQKHCYQKIIHCIHNKFASTQRQPSIQRSIKITSVLELFLQYQCMKINAKLRYKHFPGYISLNAVTFVISVRQINIIKVSKFTLANQRQADSTPKILLAFSTISKNIQSWGGEGGSLFQERAYTGITVTYCMTQYIINLRANNTHNCEIFKSVAHTWLTVVLSLRNTGQRAKPLKHRIPKVTHVKRFFFLLAVSCKIISLCRSKENEEGSWNN